MKYKLFNIVIRTSLELYFGRHFCSTMDYGYMFSSSTNIVRCFAFYDVRPYNGHDSCRQPSTMEFSAYTQANSIEPSFSLLRLRHLRSHVRCHPQGILDFVFHKLQFGRF
jgi:hypothetical protein